MLTIPYLPYLRPGFPAENNSKSSESLVFEYVGPETDLPAPKEGEIWGEAPWRVETASLERVAASGYVILRVTAVIRLDDGISAGTLSETSFELEWVAVRRPLYEHPGFSDGGSSPLSFQDLIDIQFWKDSDWSDRREYKFKDENEATRTLSANAQRYARYAARNIESYDDYAPVARRVKTYAGGPPPSAAAGTKTTMFPSFPNTPSGTFEWLKSADRGLRAAGQRDWQQSEELLGATKILVDSRNLYLA